MKIKGIYFFYRVLQAFLFPFLLLYFLWRGLSETGYRDSLGERFGFLPRSFRQTGPGAIWLHSVSVGELLASLELVKALRQELPHTRIFVSTTTPAGRHLASEKFRAWVNGVFYAPVDYVWAVRRVLRTLQPSVVVIVETEIWPNLFREVKRTRAALAIVNGRISDRAYRRYQSLVWFFRAVLPAPDAIHVQSEPMRQRFLESGARPEHVQVTGNFKYDFEARPASRDSPVVALIERLRPAKIWIAASTMPPAQVGDIDEDDAVVASFQELSAIYPKLLLILAPRKPERFDIAAKKLQAAGLNYLRRSELANPGPFELPGVLLLDSIGELNGLFFLADVVFLGGTLARRGGHNILEPALFAKPVIVGPHMQNFQIIADEFRQAGASVEIANAKELTAATKHLLDHPETAQQIGCCALTCAEARRGATAAAVTLTRDLYIKHLPEYRPAMVWLPLLWTLSRLWIKASRIPVQSRKLDAPVISVGNLTMGGTGKTPCVLRLAAAFRQRGRRPGILTRGYGRRSPEKLLILPPQASIEPERTGDEAQLFLRSGLAPVGIGPDRLQTGMQLLRHFGADLLLLDDGFQHRRLARAADIVLIDALNPFGGGHVFPWGWLREPMDGLSRADIILITRSNLSDLIPAIEREIRRWNRKAPIFHARTEPQAWIEHSDRTRYAPAKAPFERAAAFCGLGNPQAFRRTLEMMHVTLADWHEFDDHHRYRPRELQYLRAHALARGADALVTTQKDAVNLCERSSDLAAPLPIFLLETAFVIEREEELLARIEQQALRLY